jgi:hypothetical protein
MQRMLRTGAGQGEFFRVTDEPTTEPHNFIGGKVSSAPALVSLLLGILVGIVGYGRLRRR